ncbi:hypothetical protein C8F01DRAFT_1076152 [Mycena amicta]|nr:hypothetical protein C8F01DRAFT_1076152 [Mycena amicta]
MDGTGERHKSIPSIPEETLLLILKHALPPSWSRFYGEDRVPFPSPVFSDSRQDTLTKLSIVRVSRTWYRVGVELLYESVMLRRVDQLPVLVHTLEERRDIALRVRRVGLCYYLTPGWQRLHLEESEKLLALCPAISSLSIGGMVFLSPNHEFPIPIMPGNLASSITHLDIQDEHIPYQKIFPLLSALSSSLHTLVISLPTTYALPDGAQHPRLTFSRLSKLRLHIYALSRVSPTHWVIPSLTHLSLTFGDLILPGSPYATPALQVRALVEAYGRHLAHLSLPHLDGTNPTSAHEFTVLQEMLDMCPSLRRLGVSIVHCTGTGTALAHPRVEALDIFDRRVVGGCDVDVDVLKAGMPRLRVCRYLEEGYFGDALPTLDEEADATDGPGSDVRMYLLSPFPIPDDDPEDLDWVDPDDADEQDGEGDAGEVMQVDDDSDSEPASSDYDTDELIDAALQGGAGWVYERGIEEPVEWEVGREEAMEIFREESTLYVYLIVHVIDRDSQNNHKTFRGHRI